MAQESLGEVVQGEVTTIFTDEELKHIIVLEREADYLDVGCGCTLRRFGDTAGKLRIYAEGRLEIFCQCNRCDLNENSGNKISPAEFVKHAGRRDFKEWKNRIWINNNEGKKIRLWRTCLLKYYREETTALVEVEGSCRRHQIVHRDEFIRCSVCNKERRFPLQTKEKCRIYHDALANKKWKCSDMPYDQINCSSAEERNCRKASRGCLISPRCQGCTSCVCFGCTMCRFTDCNCRTCVDCIQNAAP